MILYFWEVCSFFLIKSINKFILWFSVKPRQEKRSSQWKTEQDREKAISQERETAYWTTGFGQENCVIKSAFVSCNAYAAVNKL